MAEGHAMIHRVDEALAKGEEVDFEGENQAMSDFIEEQTQVLLEQILFDASNLMTNRYGVSD